MNDNKFFIINTLPLWNEGKTDENLEIGAEGITLDKSSDYTYEETYILSPVVPVSLDRDACGVFYILDKLKKSVFIYDMNNQNQPRFGSIVFENPVSIAVNEFDIYVVDRVVKSEGQEGWKLYCAARVNGQVRREREIQPDARIAPCGNDRLYVLDIQDRKVFKTGWEWNLEEGKIELLDKNGQPYELAKPTDIASDRDANIYILQALKGDQAQNEEQPGNKEIVMFEKSGRFIQSISIPFEPGVEFLNLAVENSDNIFLGFEKEGTAGAKEKSRGLIQLTKKLEYATPGTYISKVFDSTLTGCRWSKVVLDADIPANTRVTLSYVASDDEPRIDEPFDPDSIVNLSDALLKEAVGRYIRFKIELSGDENAWNAPIIRSLKILFPTVTYLRYLPGIYQEDEKNREFLERFLALFETFMVQSEERIFNFTKYLDPAVVPGEFIHWLSSWLAIAYDENWTGAKKRQLIRLAPALYKKRGAPWTLSRLIELFCGITPIIIEPFHFKCIEEDNEEYKKLLKKLYGLGPYRFTVLVQPQWEDPLSPLKKAKQVTAAERSAMQRIIDTEKPAHTVGCLQVLEPWFYLDMHTYLEINTVLTKPEFILEKSSVLGRDTVIYEKEQGGQVGRKSRIGIGFKLT